MVLLMPRVRTEEQLQLAREAPPRPEKKDAGGDAARWRELQCGWVAAWGGRLLEAGVSDKAWTEWWKQSKTQHKALLRFASMYEDTNDVAAGAPNSVAEGAPPAKVVAPAVYVAALDYVTTAWLQRHAPQITNLSASTGVMNDGSKRVFLKALVAGEEREASVDYSLDSLQQQDDEGRKGAHRKREEAALLQLASGPERAAASAAAKRSRLEVAARLRQQLAPERARRAKLRRAEWLRRRRLGEKDVPCDGDYCDGLDSIMGDEGWNEHVALAALEQGLAVPCCILRSRLSAGGETECRVRWCLGDPGRDTWHVAAELEGTEAMQQWQAEPGRVPTRDELFGRAPWTERLRELRAARYRASEARWRARYEYLYV